MFTEGLRAGRLARTAVALAIVALAMLVRLALDPLIHDQIPFILAVAAVVVATWFCDVLGGVVATAVSAPVVNYLFVEPRWHLKADQPDSVGALVTFAVVALGLVWFVARLKDAERRLRTQADQRREAETRIRTLSRAVEQTPVAIVITDADGNIEYVNPAFTRVTGYTFAEVIGQNPRILKSGESPPEAYGELWRTVTSGGEWRGEFHNRRKNGELYWEYASISPVADDNGITHFLAVKEDITERKRTEAILRDTAGRLEKADRLKDEFIATVSHELRTPLNAVLGWAEMLRTRQLPASSQGRALEAIVANARRQTQLIDDLLDVSRIIAGRVHLEPVAIEPGTVVRAAVESVMPAAVAKQITMDVSPTRTPCAINVDPARLQQVVWNLLSNAVKFTPEGGRVSVEVNATDDQVQLVVSDNGLGITPEFLPHVFDRFRQADSRPTRSHGGLGLGLSIVRHLVEAHGGTVQVDSRGLGTGATFTVTLPVRPFEDRRQSRPSVQAIRTETPAEPVDQPDLPSLSGVRVLVVDDESDAREMTGAVLGHYGATVAAAASAREALETLRAFPADVLLIDIAMPETDGYSLIEGIRKANGLVPAVALTAYAREEDRRHALESGFQRHLAKPVTPATLVSTIAELCPHLTGPQDGSRRFPCSV